MAFNLTGNRKSIAGPSEAENETFHDPSKNRQHIVGTNFGVVTEILTAPNGNLLVVSLDHGAIYEVFKLR